MAAQDRSYSCCNLRVSKNLRDYYDGVMKQTRVINGEDVLFERFSDRYSLIGFARIVNPYIETAPTAVP